MISVHRFQTPLIIRWKSGVSVQDFFILSQLAGVNQLLCCICVQFSDALDAHFAQFCHVNGVFSLPVSFSPSLFLSSAFYYSLLIFRPLSLFVCLCGVFLLVSQADDDSSQTPSDYTVRPNIKIHNLGEWLCACWKWAAANCQMPVNIWLRLPSSICVQIIVEGNHPFVSLFILWLGKENPQVIAGWWVQPLFSSQESFATGVRQ